MRDFLTDKLEALQESLRDLGESIRDFFSELGDNLIEGLRDDIESARESLSEWVWQMLRDSLEGALTAHEHYLLHTRQGWVRLPVALLIFWAMASALQQNDPTLFKSFVFTAAAAVCSGAIYRTAESAVLIVAGFFIAETVAKSLLASGLGLLASDLPGAVVLVLLGLYFLLSARRMKQGLPFE
jgi:hypothetical protein